MAATLVFPLSGFAWGPIHAMQALTKYYEN